MTDKPACGRFAIVPSRAVEDRRLGPAALRVLALLSAHAGRLGCCKMSMKTIGECIGVSRQAAQRSVSRLADTGYVDRHHRRRPDGGSATNLYRIPVS